MSVRQPDGAERLRADSAAAVVSRSVCEEMIIAVTDVGLVMHITMARTILVCSSSPERRRCSSVDSARRQRSKTSRRILNSSARSARHLFFIHNINRTLKGTRINERRGTEINGTDV